MEKAASIFSLFCGTAMFAVWGVLLSTGKVPELHTSPLLAAALLAAEFLTALALVLGGFGLLTAKPWGFRADLAALGMLLYCAVYSIGVFGQPGNVPAAGFFVVIATLATVFAASFILESVQGGTR